MRIYGKESSRIYLVEKSLYLDWVGMRRSWLDFHSVGAMAFFKPSHSFVFPSCVHSRHPKLVEIWSRLSADAFLLPKRSGLLCPVVQVCCGMRLAAFLQSAVLHALQLLQISICSGRLPACLNFYLKYYCLWLTGDNSLAWLYSAVWRKSLLTS